jgi:hypothetical protein
MVLANTTKSDISAIDNRIIAFFKKKEDAYKAISELRQSGFTTDQIGLMTGDEYQSTAGEGTRAKHDESFWDKVKDFFTGESHEAEDIDYRETSSRWNWDTNRADYYYNGINAGGALVSVTGSRIVEAQRILKNAGGDLRESGFEANVYEQKSNQLSLVKCASASGQSRIPRPFRKTYGTRNFGQIKTAMWK